MKDRERQALVTNISDGNVLWTNRLGRPVSKPEIKRILCLKLDHIGDMLVADNALRLLRCYFPKAHVTILCGPWNEKLTRRLGIADEIFPVNLFHVSGAAQHDHLVASEMRKRGLEEISRLDLGEFDLAVDLRIDDDTRDLLKLFSARVYAGCGNLSRFPFLDISLPTPDSNPNSGPNSFRLAPRDFVAGSGYETKSFGVGFPGAISMVDLEFKVVGAKTPKECGTSMRDNRLLGVGLKEVELWIVRPDNPAGDQKIGTRYFVEGSKDLALLQEGWSLPEAWGTWSTAVSASLALAIQENIDEGCELRLKADFVAHINKGNTFLDVELHDKRSGRSAKKRCEMPHSPGLLELDLPVSRKWGRARSRDFSLRAGYYRIDIETYRPDPSLSQSLDLEVWGSKPARTIVRHEFRLGPKDSIRARLSANLEVLDPSEDLHVEIGPGADNQNNGLYVVSLTGTSEYVAPARVPSATMESRLAHLVFAVALQFSDCFGGNEIETVKALTSLSEKDRTLHSVPEIDRFLVARRDCTKLFVGVGVGATKETKRWPFAYFLEFCQLLLSNPAVILVFCGGTAELEETAAVELALDSNTRVINICGQTPLESFGSVVGLLDLYIGYDTGTTHYAGKTGVRTVGIFSAVHSPREWGPVGPNATWITLYTECSPCYLANLEDCRYGHACMLDLRPQDCWELISKVLTEISVAKSEVVSAGKIGSPAIGRIEVLADQHMESHHVGQDLELNFENGHVNGDGHAPSSKRLSSSKRAFLASAGMDEILQSTISWASFDASYYQSLNAVFSDEHDAEYALEHYITQGVLSGLSPNRWFDERFYRIKNPDVCLGIERGAWASGFEHYCREGHKDRAPHWLFDPAYYLEQNPNLTDERLHGSYFVNSYDHYLQFGNVEGRSAHPMFDPTYYVSKIPLPDVEVCRKLGAFKHFVLGEWRGDGGFTCEPAISPIFDSEVYRKMHPELTEQIRIGEWHSSVHHFLSRPKDRSAQLGDLYYPLPLEQPAMTGNKFFQ